MARKLVLSVVLTLALSWQSLFAHCDSVEGPVVKAAQKALETGNLNYVLVWVQPEDEAQINTLFQRVSKVLPLNSDAEELARSYFYESVVRIHRAGEGAPYEGLKPAGYTAPEGIQAADHAVESGDPAHLLEAVNSDQKAHVEEMFDELRKKSLYDVNDVKAGREYVASYVHFIHYIENLFTGSAPSPHHHH